MYDVDDETLRALRSSQVGGLRADAFYLGELTTQVDVVAGDVQFRGDGQVQGDAKLLVSGLGESLVPHSMTDPLAPFGQEVAIWRTVIINKEEVEFPLGVYRIMEAANGREFYRDDVVVGWEVELALQDRLSIIIDDDFLAPESPPVVATVWSEIQRLSPIPVVVNPVIEDVQVPRATVYESRMRAIEDVAGMAGAVPHMTRTGELTLRAKDAWLTETVPVFDIPGVIQWDDNMLGEFFNQVLVTSTEDNDISAWAILDDDSSPLSVDRAGGRTYKHSSPVYKTRAAAEAGAKTVLARVSQRKARNVTVTVGPEGLLLDLGDYGRVRDPISEREVLGEVAALSIPLDPTTGISVSLIVAETRGA